MLAIVIPYFKLTFFELTLQSLANQTDKRFKVYIGDDASPENPTELLEKYRGLFNFDYHQFESNLGSVSLVKQWQRCIALSNDEDWIMILGDDDYLDSNVVAKWHESYGLFNEKSNVVRFASKIIMEESKMVSDVYIHPVWESATDSFYRKFVHLTRSSLSEYIFRRASYLKFGFNHYPMAWNSDDHAWLNLSNNKPIFTINESLVYIRVSLNSISGKSDNILQKNLGNIQFYEFIILNKLKFYNKRQRKRLLENYEKTIKNNRKLNLYEWLLIHFSYIKYLDSNSLKKIFIRFIKSILRYE